MKEYDRIHKIRLQQRVTHKLLVLKHQMLAQKQQEEYAISTSLGLIYTRYTFKWKVGQEQHSEEIKQKILLYSLLCQFLQQFISLVQVSSVGNGGTHLCIGP